MTNYIPHLKINYDSIITFPRSVNSLIGAYSLNSGQRKLLLERFRTGLNPTESVINYTGRVSPAVARKIFQKVDLLLQISPLQTVFNRVTNKSQSFKLVFITLTISSAYKNTDHRIIQKECLKPLLNWLKKSKGVKDYVWRAELTKAGAIHYHIVSNRFIEYDQLRNTWNRYLDKIGLLDRQKELYGSKDANSTDIRAAKNSKSVRSYVRKYLSKSRNDDQKINGKTWDCSLNLKRSTQYTDFLEDYTWDRLEDSVKAGKVERKDFEFSTIFIVAPFLIHYYLTESQKRDYLAHIDQIQKHTNNKLPPVQNSPKKVPATQSNRLKQALKAPSQQELKLKIRQQPVMKSANKSEFG